MTTQEKQTPAPWTVGSEQGDGIPHRNIWGKRGSVSILVAEATSLEDAELICDLRNELSSLLSEIARLREALKKIEREASRATTQGTHSNNQHNALKFIGANAADALSPIGDGT